MSRRDSGRWKTHLQAIFRNQFCSWLNHFTGNQANRNSGGPSNFGADKLCDVDVFRSKKPLPVKKIVEGFCSQKIGFLTMLGAAM